MLFLMIPVASAEHSYLKLKIMKHYLRNTMSQEQLSSLCILSIENETANALRHDLDAIIKMLAKAKVRLKDILKFFHDCHFFTDYNTIMLFLLPSCKVVLQIFLIIILWNNSKEVTMIAS